MYHVPFVERGGPVHFHSADQRIVDIGHDVSVGWLSGGRNEVRGDLSVWIAWNETEGRERLDARRENEGSNSLTEGGR